MKIKYLLFITCIYILFIPTFMETFKVLKYCSPISIYKLLLLSPREGHKITLILPKVNIDVLSKLNFIFMNAIVWNKISKVVFNKCHPQTNGIVIPGSSLNSDMAASISVIKNKLKIYLFDKQKLGHETDWTTDNLLCSYMTHSMCIKPVNTSSLFVSTLV